MMTPDEACENGYLYLELPDGSVRRMTDEERASAQFPPGTRCFKAQIIASPNPRCPFHFEYKGYKAPPEGWRWTYENMEQIEKEGRFWFTAPPPDGRVVLKRYLDERKPTP